MKISKYFEQCENEVVIEDVEKNDGVILIVISRKNNGTRLSKYAFNINVYEAYGALTRFKQYMKNVILGKKQEGDGK